MNSWIQGKKIVRPCTESELWEGISRQEVGHAHHARRGAKSSIIYRITYLLEKSSKNIAKEVPKKQKSDDFGDGRKYIRMSAKRCQKCLKLKDYIQDFVNAFFGHLKNRRRTSILGDEKTKKSKLLMNSKSRTPKPGQFQSENRAILSTTSVPPYYMALDILIT